MSGARLNFLRFRSSLALLVALLVFALGLFSCSFLSQNHGAICSGAQALAEAAELVCSLSADSTADPEALREAALQLTRQAERLRVDADSVYARRLRLLQ